MAACVRCGRELVEVERWQLWVDDFAAEKRRHGLGPLSDNERARFEQYVGSGSWWRVLTCPVDPAHVGQLFERVQGP